MGDEHSAPPRASTNIVTPGDTLNIITNAQPQVEEGRRSTEPRPSSVFPNSANIDESRPSAASDSYYPSWLPRRPARPVHPGPSRDTTTGRDAVYAGDLRSSNEESSAGRPSDVAGGPDAVAGPSSKRRWAHKHGRKPAERNVRVLKVPPGHADPAGLVPRSRNVAIGVEDEPRTPTSATTAATRSSHDNMFTRREYPRLTGSRPRFRVPGLQLHLVEHPSRWNRILFFLFPILVFAHVPVQAFLDFNAAYMLLQVARHPTPSAPGAPTNGRGWAFAFAAYLTIYFIYFFGVFIGYEIIYSFWRRWRSKRPLMLPIYLSAPASNLAAMTSYSTFCFFQYVRASAFKASDHGSVWDGLAETCFGLSQNLPTVLLLLPRAAICLALLLSFASASASAAAVGNLGASERDGTFYNQNGLLTSYGKGILIANAAWTAWRAVVLIFSWVGLWIFSGQSCGGICGPRYRWEEDEDPTEKAEENPSSYYLSRNESVVERWPWLPFTAARLQDAYELCFVVPRRKDRDPEKRLSKQTEAPPALPAMREISEIGPMGFNRRVSEPETARDRSNSAADEGTLVPPSPPVALHGRSRSVATAAAVAGAAIGRPGGTPPPFGSPRQPRSRHVSTQGGVVEIPQTPERAARSGAGYNGVVSASGGGKRRSVLDNDLFAALPSASKGAQRSSAPSSERSDSSKRNKGKRRESTRPSQTNIFLSGDGHEREQGGASQDTTLVPPMVAGGAIIPALPFPLKAVGEDSPPPEVYDLTPPRGSDVDQEEDDDGVEGLHKGANPEQEDEEDEAAQPHGLEGFVVGEDDTREFGTGPRISSDQTSGSLSSLGQPIFSGLALLGAGDSATGRRSHSLGSTQRSPLSNSASSRGRGGGGSSDRWSSLGSHNRPESRNGVAHLEPPPRRHPSAGSRQRTRTMGSSSRTPSILSSSLSSGGDRTRERAISLQDQTFGQQLPLPPVEGVDEHGRYEDDLYEEEEDQEEEEELGRVHDDLDGVVIGDSDEEEEEGGEKEDSVGLLSNGPSPQSSIGALRSRANSLVSAGRRRGSTGSGTGSNTGTATQHALSNSGGGPRSRTTSFGIGGRSRQSSSATTQIPITRKSPPVYDERALRADMEDLTFGISTVPVNWDNVPRLSASPPRSRQLTINTSPPPLPLPSLELVRSLRPVGSRSSDRSRGSQGGRSDSGGRAINIPNDESGEVSVISEAPSSYVTAAPTSAISFDDSGTVSGDTVRSYVALDDPSRNMMG